MSPRPRPAKERFEEKYIPEPNTGCWLWIGDGWRDYGRFWTGHDHLAAHRAAWLLFRGEIPKGMFVCHKCDVPWCVNPDHLFLGTALENAQDRDRKGRQISRRGEDAGRAKLTEAQVLTIKQLLGHRPRGYRRIGSQQFGVSTITISRIVSGAGWKHLP